jgi:hypothetical protein
MATKEYKLKRDVQVTPLALHTEILDDAGVIKSLQHFDLAHEV